MSPSALDRALMADASWLHKQLATLPPGEAHALNLQVMLFRWRLSIDVAFYAETWRRINQDSRLWEHIRLFIEDVARDWRGSQRPNRKTAKTKAKQRVQREYLAPFYQEPRKTGRSIQHRTVFEPDAKPTSQAGAPFEMPQPTPAVAAAFVQLIQLCRETFVASRRLHELWAQALGRHVAEDLDLYPTDSKEDEFTRELMEVIASRILPQRYFLMKTQDQRDALLAMPTALRLPLCSYADLAGALALHVHPDRDLPTIIEEGARALIDQGAPELADGLIEAYLPDLMRTGPVPELLYHDRYLALADQGRWPEALQAAADLQAQATTEFLAFQARLCLFDASRRSNESFDARTEANLILEHAKSPEEPRTRVGRLLAAAVEFEAAGLKRHMEQALLEATTAAGQDAVALQAVLAFRPRPKGVPARNPHLFGTPGWPGVSLAELIESYYRSYPDERP